MFVATCNINSEEVIFLGKIGILVMHEQIKIQKSLIQAYCPVNR